MCQVLMGQPYSFRFHTLFLGGSGGIVTSACSGCIGFEYIVMRGWSWTDLKCVGHGCKFGCGIRGTSKHTTSVCCRALPGINSAAVGLIVAAVFQLGLKILSQSPFMAATLCIGEPSSHMQLETNIACCGRLDIWPLVHGFYCNLLCRQHMVSKGSTCVLIQGIVVTSSQSGLLVICKSH